MLGDCSRWRLVDVRDFTDRARRRQCPSRGLTFGATAPGSWCALLQPITAVGTLRRILAFRLLAFDAQRKFVGYSIALSARRFEGVWQSEHTSGFSDEGRRFGCSSH